MIKFAFMYVCMYINSQKLKIWLLIMLTSWYILTRITKNLEFKKGVGIEQQKVRKQVGNRKFEHL